MASLWRYLRVFARPVPVAGNVATVVQAAGLLVSVISGAAVFGRTFAPAVGVAVGLGILFVLAVIAGVQIQREADQRGLWQLVERDLRCAWDEARYALSHPGGILATQPGPLDDWYERTSEYLLVVLGPAAAAQFRNPVSGRAWDDIVQQHVDRLIALADRVHERPIRVSGGDLRDAAHRRCENRVREMMQAAAMAPAS